MMYSFVPNIMHASATSSVIPNRFIGISSTFFVRFAYAVTTTFAPSHANSSVLVRTILRAEPVFSAASPTSCPLMDCLQVLCEQLMLFLILHLREHFVCLCKVFLHNESLVCKHLCAGKRFIGIPHEKGGQSFCILQ